MDELTNFEKLVESVNMLATLVHSYYQALRERGFSDDQAMFLVGEYQDTVLNFAKGTGNQGNSGE